MTFKQFMGEVAYLPATVFSGIVSLILGSTKKDSSGKVERDKEQNAKVNSGLLNLLLDAVSFIGRSISDFIANHQTAIATAFWSSLILGGAAALTVFLWPAALTAITTFPIYGFTIAGVVGANTTLQIGAVGALAFAATSAATYLVASVVNTISAIVECFKRPAPNDSTSSSEDSSNEEEFEDSSSKLRELSGNGLKNDNTVVLERPKSPVQTAPLFSSSGSQTIIPRAEPAAESAPEAASEKGSACAL